jgi:hypothetical protein
MECKNFKGKISLNQGPTCHQIISDFIRKMDHLWVARAPFLKWVTVPGSIHRIQYYDPHAYVAAQLKKKQVRTHFCAAGFSLLAEIPWHNFIRSLYYPACTMHPASETGAKHASSLADWLYEKVCHTECVRRRVQEADVCLRRRHTK